MSRIKYFDIAKGIIILAIIFYHAACIQQIWWYGTNWVFYWITAILVAIFMPWTMSAFFLMRGSYNKELPLVDEIKGSIKRLLVPMVILQYEGEQWFCWALFFALIFYNLVNRIKPYSLRLLALAILPFIGCTMNHFGVDVHYIKYGLLMTPFLEIGKRWKWIFTSNVAAWTSLFLIIGLLFVHFKYNIFGNIQFAITGITYPSVYGLPLSFSLGILGTSMFFGISRWIGENSFLEYVGRNSLIFFLVHFAFVVGQLHIVGNYINEIHGPNSGIISLSIYLAISLISLGGSYICSVLINKYCPWLTGKGL